MKINRVSWDRKVAKQLAKIPEAICRKFYAWVSVIELVGIMVARKSPGFHDEALKGKRFGQRSARLNKAYRVIYIEQANEIIVLEVNKHEY